MGVSVLAIARVFVVHVVLLLFLLIVISVVIAVVIIEIDAIQIVLLVIGFRLDAVLVDCLGDDHSVRPRLLLRVIHLLSDDLLVLLVLACRPLPVHHRSIHVRRRRSVRLVEQRDHRQQNSTHVLSGIPSLAGQLSTLRVVHGRVKDRDAQVTILKDIRMPDFGGELDGGRRVGVVGREADARLEVTTLQKSSGRSEDADVPREEVVVVNDDVEALDGLRPQTLQLHGESTEGAARTRSSHLQK
ncbi:hypothetical protein PMAYCL1PPCAC_24558, partial [Pristionchus mayeri]